MAIAVEFSDVVYRLNGRTIISSLSFQVPEGELMVLLGRSGCGKTTTLKLVNRLLDPQQGEIRVGGRPTREWDAIVLRRRVGYVIQEVGLFPHFTVARNVSLVPRLEGWEPERIAERTRELLELVGLDAEAYADRFPAQLSGGQKQRVGVARALAADPPLLLMDEPFGALDPLTRCELQREFRQLQRGLGKTVLLVTHDLREAVVLGDRIGLMKEGRLAFSGAPRELLASRDREVVSFIEPLRSGLDF